MIKNTYILKLVCIYILLLSIITVFNLEIKVDKYKVNTKTEEKVLSSTVLIKEEPEEKIIPEINFSNTTIDTSTFPVLSQEIINLSHYGHDCYGCKTGYTASGYYVGDGRIYYEDATFGTVRVVAADDKYPLGTIVRIGYNNSVITAIVLDRGGGIGDGNKFQIDLLASNNSEAYKLGTVQNTNLEVLRLGY